MSKVKYERKLCSKCWGWRSINVTINDYKKYLCGIHCLRCGRYRFVKHIWCWRNKEYHPSKLVRITGEERDLLKSYLLREKNYSVH